jgi:hypothetical protein
MARRPIRYDMRLTNQGTATLSQPAPRFNRPAHRDGRGRGRRAAWTVLAGLLAVLTLVGCASSRLPAWARDGARPVAGAEFGSAATPAAGQSARSPATAPTAKPAPAAGRPADLSPPPEPQWRTTREALGLNEPARTAVPLGQGGPVFTPFSQTLPELKREVALICGSARVNKQQDYLAPLVTDLYLSGVDPAFATEALIQGDCGSLAAVVRELVAQGGNAVVAAVVSRAVFLSGPGAEGTIRVAASKGLDRDLVSPMQHAEQTRDPGSLAYSMAYFASRAPQSGVETATAVNTLYSNATPRYGVYTFVLLGGTFDAAVPAQRTRHTELLRVIETYVLAGEGAPQGPRTETHAFLVAIRPADADAKLSEQSGPELSAGMRKDLTQYLRSRNQMALAQRLETRPGPFLISSLEPRLLPTSDAAPRLVTDLSDLGNEYMYAVVDAYDRPIPPEEQGRPAGLTAIRDRLLGLFSRKVSSEDLSPTIKDAWVFRIGGPPAAAPDATPPPAKVPADGPAPGGQDRNQSAAPPKKIPQYVRRKAVRPS